MILCISYWSLSLGNKETSCWLVSHLQCSVLLHLLSDKRLVRPSSVWQHHCIHHFGHSGRHFILNPSFQIAAGPWWPAGFVFLHLLHQHHETLLGCWCSHYASLLCVLIINYHSLPGSLFTQHCYFVFIQLKSLWGVVRKLQSIIGFYSSNILWSILQVKYPQVDFLRISKFWWLLVLPDTMFWLQPAYSSVRCKDLKTLHFSHKLIAITR